MAFMEASYHDFYEYLGYMKLKYHIYLQYWYYKSTYNFSVRWPLYIQI